MSQSFTFSEKPLFKDADLLECDHVPDQVLFRDAELEELAFLIRPGLRGQRLANILCRGLPGTGKTTCIHHLFTELRDHSQNLIPVYVNCQRSRTAFAVFSTIYCEVVGHATPSSGIPLRKLMDAVAKALQSRRQSERTVLLVCLDDIHHLIHEGTDTQILSSLLRIYLDYPGCRVSVILVESDLALDLSRRLDRSVLSSLCMEEVFFAPYSAAQIRGILRERSRQAVYPGVISPDILDLITDRTLSTDPCDLRVGIDLLKRSILRAERAGRPAVTEEDVAAAYGDARTTHLRGLVSVLTEKEKTLLSVIAGMVEEGGLPTPTSGKIYSRLQEVLAAGAGRAGGCAGCAEPEPGYGTGSGTSTSTSPSPSTSNDNSTSRGTSTHNDNSTLNDTVAISLRGGDGSTAASSSYTQYYENLKSLDRYALVSIAIRQAKGRTSEVTLRYPASDVRRMCGGR